MKHLSHFGILAAVLLLPFHVYGEGEDVADYYPLKPGSKWHYRIDNGLRTYPGIYEITKIETVAGERLARLVLTAEGKEFGRQYVTSNSKGVFFREVSGNTNKEPFCILQYPIKEADSWEAETTAEGKPARYVFRLTHEQVQVPAGTYKAVKVVTDGDINGKTYRTINWYAQGVGVVKQSHGTRSRQSTVLELQKFEVAE